jgi:hypothetical protein
MNKFFGLVAALSVLSGSALAGSTNQTDQLLDRLVGRWVLSGTIASRKTTHDVSAEWVLNHGYVRLHEVAREKNPAGAPAYEAIVFISKEPSSGDYTCLWLDSTGSWGISADAIGRAKPKSNSIPFVFKDPNGHVSFENTFSYDPAADSWAWTMDNIQDGKHVPFGRVTLLKAPH